MVLVYKCYVFTEEEWKHLAEENGVSVEVLERIVSNSAFLEKGNGQVMVRVYIGEGKDPVWYKEGRAFFRRFAEEYKKYLRLKEKFKGMG